MTAPIPIVRRLLVAVGVLSLLAGLVVSVGPAVRWPWGDETLLVAFFTVAFSLACLVAPVVLIDDRTEQSTAAPERVPSTPTPGRELERLLDSRWPASLPRARRRRIRNRLRRTAIRTIVRTSDCSGDAARERLERGTWTDDPVAAAFVRRDGTTDSPRLRAVVERVRFRRRARRTARAILDLAEEGERRG